MDEQTLQDIKSHARLQFFADEVERKLGLESGAINNSTEANEAYWQGVLEGQTSIRQALMERIENGDVQAARELNKYADKLAIEDG